MTCGNEDRKLGPKNNFKFVAIVAALLMLLAQFAGAASVNTRALTNRSRARKVNETTHVRKRMRRLARSRTQNSRLLTASHHRRRHRYYEHFTANSFMDDTTEGDVTSGEDLIVRQAAVDALGNMNGTVLAIE